MWLLSYSTAKFRDSMLILREASLADETFDLVLYKVVDIANKVLSVYSSKLVSKH
jgi:hypothetical protein